MKLKKGDLAPNFTVKDIHKQEFQLKDFKGQKVHLTFYKTASCPFCNLRVNQIINQMDYFNKHNVKVLGFFASDRDEIMSYVGKQKPPFSIIPDPMKVNYQKYGSQSTYLGMLKSFTRISVILESMKKGFFSMKPLLEEPILPAEFLINEKGRIDKVYYGEDSGDHIAIQNIKEWVEAQ